MPRIRSSKSKITFLLPFAGEIESADTELSAKLTPEILREIVELIPDEWLENAVEQKKIYLEFLTKRLEREK